MNLLVYADKAVYYKVDVLHKTAITMLITTLAEKSNATPLNFGVIDKIKRKLFN